MKKQYSRLGIPAFEFGNIAREVSTKQAWDVVLLHFIFDALSHFFHRDIGACKCTVLIAVAAVLTRYRPVFVGTTALLVS